MSAEFPVPSAQWGESTAGVPPVAMHVQAQAKPEYRRPPAGGVTRYDFVMKGWAAGRRPPLCGAEPGTNN